MRKTDLPADYLRQVFYEKDGHLYWKEKHNRNYEVDSLAEYPHPSGYLQIFLDGRWRYVHRIIYVLHHGVYPDVVDHIDGNKANNLIGNLRSCNYHENFYNAGRSVRNTSGIKGIYYDITKDKWRGRVCFMGRSYSAGIHSDISVMQRLVENLRSKLHGEFCNHGNI